MSEHLQQQRGVARLRERRGGAPLAVDAREQLEQLERAQRRARAQRGARGALQVELLPDYVALRPLEMWCDFPPFSGFDFTLDSVLAPAADAAADDSLDDASSEEEPAKPPPPSKSKTKTPKRG